MEAETNAMNLFPWFYLWCGVGLKCKMYPIKDCPNPVKSFHSDKGNVRKKKKSTNTVHNLHYICTIFTLFMLLVIQSG